MEITLNLAIIICLVSLAVIVHKVSPKITNTRITTTRTPNESFLQNNGTSTDENNNNNGNDFPLTKLLISTNKNESNSTTIKLKKTVHIPLIGWEWAKVKNGWIFCVFLLIAAFSKIGYHYSTFLTNFIPESCILVLIGLAFGTSIHFLDQTHEVPKFTVDLFFFALLPPIILESAYSLHDRDFFNNIGTILLYAVVGTFINITLIGVSLYCVDELNVKWLKFPHISFIELMIFSSAISAVDPVSVLAIFKDLSVNKPLYFLVFGESLLNDAVVIVVHRLLEAMLGVETVTGYDFMLGLVAFLLVSVGGFLIGCFFGALTSVLTMKTTHVRVVEPMIMVAMAYIAFLSAEIVHWSGIISIIGCGLFQAEYAFKNVSRKSYTTVKYFAQTLSTISDLLIFFFLGTMLINEKPVWNTSFALLSLVFCVVYRFVSVFVLTFVANYLFKREPSIKCEEQTLMAYGGLRGAVAFALIAILNNVPGINHFGLFRTTTLFIIIFSVFFLGGTTKPLLKLLRIRKEEKNESKLFHILNDKLIEEVMHGISEISETHTFNYYWMQKIVHINDKYIKKYLIHDGIKSQKIENELQKLIFEDEMEKIWGIQVRCRSKSKHSIKTNGMVNNAFDHNNEELYEDDNCSVTPSSSSTVVIDNTREQSSSDRQRNVAQRILQSAQQFFSSLLPNAFKKSLCNKITGLNCMQNSAFKSSKLNQLLENAFVETTINQNALRKSVNKAQYLNRQLMKNRMNTLKHMSSMEDPVLIPELRAKTAIPGYFNTSIDKQYYHNRGSVDPNNKFNSTNGRLHTATLKRINSRDGKRRVSVGSNLNVIEDYNEEH